MTEAYTSFQNTLLYYSFGSNVPFNFNFIMEIDGTSKAKHFKKVIDDWMNSILRDQSANWVVRIYLYYRFTPLDLTILYGKELTFPIKV